MNKNIEHIIHIFKIRFIQENYHSGDVVVSLIDFRRPGDE